MQHEEVSEILVRVKALENLILSAINLKFTFEEKQELVKKVQSLNISDDNITID